MTKAEQRESAEVLRLVVERIDQGDVDAPSWNRERFWSDPVLGSQSTGRDEVHAVGSP